VRLVIDTNVLVSGLLSPLGPPARIVSLLASGQLEPCTDGRLMAEYELVLRRDHLHVRSDSVDELLRLVRRYGLPTGAPPLEMHLPHPDDQPFVEVALAGGARCLVTGNGIHFPADRCLGVPVVTPAELVKVMGRVREAPGAV
jgi:putative PIN family toxin of toxin-antitoxin system